MNANISASATTERSDISDSFRVVYVASVQLEPNVASEIDTGAKQQDRVGRSVRCDRHHQLGAHERATVAEVRFEATSDRRARLEALWRVERAQELIGSSR